MRAVASQDVSFLQPVSLRKLGEGFEVLESLAPLLPLQLLEARNLFASAALGQSCVIPNPVHISLNIFNYHQTVFDECRWTQCDGD